MYDYVELLEGHASDSYKRVYSLYAEIPLPSFGIPAGPHWSYFTALCVLLRPTLQSCYVMSTQLPTSGPATLAGPAQAASLVPTSGTHTFTLLSPGADSFVEHSVVLLPTRSVAHVIAEIVVEHKPLSYVSQLAH